MGKKTDLLADRLADRLALAEPVMNPALEAQAIGRSWRMGQARFV
jgi:SNF2 family DNA or RNA helicase